MHAIRKPCTDVSLQKRFRKKQAPVLTVFS